METQTVVFEWSTEHGSCFECGRPAAFYVWPYELTTMFGPCEMACAVCAVNHACDGAKVVRISNDDD